MTYGPQFHIRPMRIDDLPRVAQIAAGLQHAPQWPASAYEVALNQESELRRLALVAESPDSGKAGSGTIIGFVVASFVAGEAELESIAVTTQAQRSRIGGHLLDHMLAALRELRVTRINLELRASNSPALNLYRQHQFKETGRRIGYYADPVEDAILMGLDLG